MTDFLLNTEGDISLEDGKISLTKNISQKVSIALKIFKGEWFLDDAIGIPYFQTILGKKISKEQIDSLFKSQILSVEGVSKIISFSSSLVDRKYSYKVSILSNENKVETLEENL